MSDSNDNELGKLVRQQRLAAGLSLEDVERKVHVDKGTLSRIENGLISSPRVELLQRIATAVGTEVEDYLTVMGIGTGGLPQLTVYLRTKYGVDAATAKDVEKYFKYVCTRDDIQEGQGISDYREDDAA